MSDTTTKKADTYIKTVDGYDVHFSPEIEENLLEENNFDKSYFNEMVNQINRGELVRFCAKVWVEKDGVLYRRRTHAIFRRMYIQKL